METCSLADVLEGTGETLPTLGEYHILALDNAHPVAVSTLGDCNLPDILAARKPNGMCVVGKTETENIGIEKIIQNTLAVPSIRYLLLCGEDSQGHFSGQTMLSLFENGVNERMRVIGAKGKRPILANTTPQTVAAFTNQIEIIDMIGCADADEIIRKIEELAAQPFSQRRMTAQSSADAVPEIKVISAKYKDPQKVKLDRAGYFVIVPKAELGIILVEHYNYANQLLRVIQGDNARDIYWTIIENNWVGEMSHAAYLGKELAAAQLSMQLGFKYIQDKA
ncbi:MAG: hypothetical protein IKY96_08215 [Oscillospiraceae bacterium]|nr:hypothetical protein [Oscillospiraceae bacterium]